jgi:YebC/PmpR family DNA-binding regulatory protein
MKVIASTLLLLISGAAAFSITTPSSPQCTRLSPLFMGRAAAVRAATKSKTDAKKAKVNALYGKKIIMAVKQGGPDPDGNRALGDLIKAAKANSVPVDNISRAIKRASEANTGDFSESTFEAYGFGGASIVINVLTDNDNRANADVRSAVGKNDGKMAEQGSVLFMYDKKGKLEAPAVLDEEELLEAAIEKDIEDYELINEDIEDGDLSVVYVEPQDTNNMFEAIKSMGIEEGLKMELVYVTKAPVEVTDEEFEKNMKIIDALEALDDVDSVEHNMSN